MVKAIYARQSVDRDDSISIESQIEFCKYELRGEPYKEYVDKGYSGKDTNRPSFKQLMQDIKKGIIETVIVYKLDRISRSILDFSAMMEEFQKNKVGFVSSTEKFDTSSPIGRAMLNICIVFAQLERETIQKRVADAYYSRSQKGFYMGGRIPYGYQIINTTIDGVKTSCYKAVPEEVEQIQLMYALYSHPEASLTDLIRYFNDNDIVHLRGRSWSTARLSELLRNPIYVRADTDIYNFYKSQGSNVVSDVADFAGVNACYLYKGETSNRKQYDLREKHLVLAPHQGIVSSAEWLACRIKCLNNRQSAIPRKPKNSWLTGKTKCRKCGYALTVRRNKQERRYFVCSANMSYSTTQCSGPGTIHAEQLESVIVDEIRGKLREVELLTPANDNSIPLVNENKAKISQIDTQIAMLVDKVIDADGPLMKYISEKVSALERERDHLLAKNLSLSQSSSNNPLPLIHDHVKRWDETSFDDRKMVADVLIQKVLIDTDNIDILWSF